MLQRNLKVTFDPDCDSELRREISNLATGTLMEIQVDGPSAHQPELQ